MLLVRPSRVAERVACHVIRFIPLMQARVVCWAVPCCNSNNRSCDMPAGITMHQGLVVRPELLPEGDAVVSLLVIHLTL